MTQRKMLLNTLLSFAAMYGAAPKPLQTDLKQQSDEEKAKKLKKAEDKRKRKAEIKSAK